MSRKRLPCPYCGAMICVGGRYGRHLQCCLRIKVENLVRVAKRYGYHMKAWLSEGHVILENLTREELEIELLEANIT